MKVTVVWSTLFALTLTPLTAARAPMALRVAADTNLPPIRLAITRLAEAAHVAGLKTFSVVSPRDRSAETADLLVAVGPSQSAMLRRAHNISDPTPPLGKEAFQIARLGEDARWVVLSPDAVGAMYGLLEVAEQLAVHKTLDQLEPAAHRPRFSFRAIKFNLPWSPYRPGPATAQHIATCRDLRFWQRFLDMMAANRFNVLSLWNLHPFPYMIRPKHFPEACPFDDAELAEWQRFWHTLFRMACDRGIQTYIVNWNIVVSPEFAKAHGVKEHNDTSALVRRYTRECVTQVIDEYPELTGLGVTLADWMNRMTPKQREDWIEETFVAGMKAASRPVKFIHRSVLAGDPLEMRRVIDHAALPDPVIVEIKFNWSHGHSTPRLALTHDYSSGRVDARFWQPTPTNYFIAWMIRNEDFFILRWGAPDFIREHIRLNGHDYVGGYFVGSEGYIPALEYAHRNPHPHYTWEYAFERQWLFYRVWGRLLYEPDTPDAALAGGFAERYGTEVAPLMLKAYTLASRMPLRLASFHAATWDFTLYSEGFLAPARSRGLFDGVSPFISIDEFIEHQTLDPTFVSIPDFVHASIAGRPIPDHLVTPIELADASWRDAQEVLDLLRRLRDKAGHKEPTYTCELDDLETWAYLSLYLAEKLRGGVALKWFRLIGAPEQQRSAIAHLARAAKHWSRAAEITSAHYQPTPHVSGVTFSWEAFKDQVARDIDIARNAEIASKPAER